MFQLPKEVVLPNRPPYNFEVGLTAEEYYKKLFEEGKVTEVQEIAISCGSAAHGQKEGHEDGDPENGDGTPSKSGPGVSSQDAEVIRDKVAEKISEEASRNRGTVPAGLERWAKKHRESKVDWRKLLATYIKRAYAQKAGKNDYTYQRISRRDYGEVIMPSTYEPIPSVSVVIDTSGSMGEKEIGMALGETAKILKQAGSREGVNVICVDAAVHTAKRVYSDRQIQVKGGGGTDMRVGIAEALKGKPRPDLVVVITDGYTPWPEQKPKAAIVVALTHKNTSNLPSYAKYVVVETGEGE
jgi:predicted metal-dependent peptidase